jgi:hypothetical protein
MEAQNEHGLLLEKGILLVTSIEKSHDYWLIKGRAILTGVWGMNNDDWSLMKDFMLSRARLEIEGYDYSNENGSMLSRVWDNVDDLSLLEDGFMVSWAQCKKVRRTCNLKSR